MSLYDIPASFDLIRNSSFASRCCVAGDTFADSGKDCRILAAAGFGSTLLSASNFAGARSVPLDEDIFVIEVVLE